MRTILALSACGLVAVSVVVAFGAASAGTARPDPAAGNVQSALCATCHGAEGISVATNVPNLAGQHYEYLIRQLLAFKSGTRKDGVMNEMVRGMSLAELRNIAAYYATVKVTVDTGKARK